MSEQAVFDALTYRIVVDEHGCSRYYNAANQLHRAGGPAVEYVDGHKEWYQNGQLHREDGPAIISKRGDKYWYQNNRLHHTDGPPLYGMMTISGGLSMASGCLRTNST